ncbi:hypothetical protein [Clostridium estertheticum]|uniref:Uncharacterized protein n=1 Tax=Clostridium estertheticum subsp. estertheticum TaxID=1552 RepID=A0A1J0GC27_9CLOT|nr:hypothetical protein [Clostridium estertheticum]APC38890.1 hypothetical protein A7L45_01810 [Clostridium estertheticum subsp. estertheticum]MBZ9615164.1 hypothetical protein [Clostridium estertheticum subsp. laramiense]WAG75058.1 hypothetical protein LL032_06295 [Clostridium estertheticum]
MIEPEYVSYEDLPNEENIAAFTYYIKGMAIYINPVYEWIEENINNISYKLLKGCISNIVPIGDAGRKFFKDMVEMKSGFAFELMNLYNYSEKKYIEGTLKIKSYIELQHLGYTGTVLFENCPVDDVWRLVREKSLEKGIPFSKKL